MTREQLQVRFANMPESVAERLADCGFRDIEHVSDLLRSDDTTRMLLGFTRMSRSELLDVCGLNSAPIPGGVALGTPCHVGGALAPVVEPQPLQGFTLPELPTHASLIDRCGPPRNQGRIGTCTAFASVASEECQFDDESPDLSEAFVYALTKAHDGQPDAEGSYLEVATRIIAQYGACRERTLAYREDRSYLRSRPPERAFAEALQFRAQSRSVLPARDVARIKAEIVAGRGVGLSLPIFKSNHASLRFHSEGRFTLPLGSFDKVEGGHAMCAVAFADNEWLVDRGFDSEVGGGAFLVRNSWGEWARANQLARHHGAEYGYAVVPYAFVREHGWEAISLRLRTHPPVTRFSLLRRRASEVVVAAGNSWWERSRTRVVSQARQRLYG